MKISKQETTYLLKATVGLIWFTPTLLYIGMSVALKTPLSAPGLIIFLFVFCIFLTFLLDKGGERKK